MTEARPPLAVVLGSVHVDLIATAARLPRPGESVTGGAFAMAPGGKAGNQAGQLARLGIPVAIVSRLGDDLFGRYLLDSLAARGVDTSAVATDRTAATGASTILAGAGEYQSIIAPGAAARLTEADVDAALTRFAGFRAFVTQLELPLAVTSYAVSSATATGALVVVNASPLPDDPAAIPSALLGSADVLVVNRVEAARLSGRGVASPDEALQAADLLRDRHGIAAVAVTMGAMGAVAVGDEGAAVQPGIPTRVVDTVGAGDAFLGTLVAARLAGDDLARALRRGVAAGALAVRGRGAYDALPDSAAIDQLLAETGESGRIA